MISVVRYGCSEIVVLFGGVCVKFWRWPILVAVPDDIVFGDLSSPQNAGCFGEVGAFDEPRQTKTRSSRRLSDIMEIARSTCSEQACVAGVVTFELRFVKRKKRVT